MVNRLECKCQRNPEIERNKTHYRYLNVFSVFIFLKKKKTVGYLEKLYNERTAERGTRCKQFGEYFFLTKTIFSEKKTNKNYFGYGQMRFY